MDLILLLLVVLLIAAVAGGVYIGNLLWILAVVALALIIWRFMFTRGPRV